MRAGGAALAILALVSSCGLETVEYLAPPPVPYYSSQTDQTKLALSFDPARYSGTQFQGFEVYYKIYPEALGVFTNLATDVSRLALSPTRDSLVGLGYQRLNGSPDFSTAEPLINLRGAAATTVTLDFSSVVGLVATPTQGALGPVPRVVLGSGSQVPVYRTVSAGAGLSSYPYFNQLYAAFTARASDQDSSLSAATPAYEVCVFAVAFSFTPEKTVYSQPAAWGVLGYFGGH